MKQMKIWMLALTLIVGISFTSCVNSNNNNSYDIRAYITTNSSYPYDASLLGDDGTVYYPTNPSALKLQNSEGYAKRAFVYMKFVEGEDGAANKKRYDVEIVGAEGVAIKNLNTQPDTLKNDYPVNNFAIWAANGYLNTAADLYAVNSIDVEFFLDYEALEEGVEDNVVPMVFQYTKGGSEFGGSTNVGSLVVSWPVPGRGELTRYGVNLSDSVVFKASAKSNSSSGLSSTFKYKY